MTAPLRKKGASIRLRQRRGGLGGGGGGWLLPMSHNRDYGLDASIKNGKSPNNWSIAVSSVFLLLAYLALSVLVGAALSTLYSTFSSSSSSSSDDDSDHNKWAATAAIAATVSRKPVDGIYDVAVLGLGPAGLSAALFAARAGLSVLVMGSETGLLSQTTHLDNFPSFSYSSGKNKNHPHENNNLQKTQNASGGGGGGGGGGMRWLRETKAQAARFGANFAPPGLLVSRIQRNTNDNNNKKDTGEFMLETTTGNGTSDYSLVRAWSVIIATGATPRRLELQQQQQIDVENELWGKSIHNCAICDGSNYVDKTVVVVGGGDAAVDAAILLARHAKRVVVVHRRDEFRAAATNQPAVEAMKQTPNIEILTPFVVEKWQTTTTKRGTKKLTGVQIIRMMHNSENYLDTRREIPCDGVFVMIGATPNTQWLKDNNSRYKKKTTTTTSTAGDIHIDLDSNDLIKLKHDSSFSQATSVPGIFAAGEVVDSMYRQAVTASAEGAKAAIDSERWLRLVGTPKRKRAAVVVPHVDKSQVQRTSAISRREEENASTQEMADCDLTKTDCIKAVVSQHAVVVFSKPWCPYCRKALEALSLEGVPKPFVIDLSAMGHKGRAVQITLEEMTGRYTVPNVFVGGKSIGGGDETTSLHRKGELGPLLRKVGAVVE